MREKKYLYTIIIISIISIIPLLVLSFYNHPSADDYTYSILTYHSWRDTNSLWNTFLEAIATSKHFWHSWQGLYSSAFVLALQPGIFGEKYYALTGIFMVLIISIGNYVFCKYILNKKLFASKLESMAFAAIITFLMMQWMPSPVEGIYWFNGAMNYGLFYSILLIFITLLIKEKEKEFRMQVISIIVIAICGIILAGGNHVTAFMGIIFGFVMLLISIYCRNKYTIVKNGIALISVFGGFIFNISSPGTATRQAQFMDRIGAPRTILRAIRYGLSYMNDWIGFPIIICMAVMLPYILKIVERISNKTGFTFKYPLFVLLLSVAWISAMFCPPIYAMGFVGGARLINIVYYFFIILIFINEFYFLGWLCQKLQWHKCEMRISNSWILTVVVFVIILSISSGYNTANSYNAMMSIYKGEAEQYSAECNERHVLLLKSKGENVMLNAFTTEPRLIFFDDITEDSFDWRNSAMASYYELTSVKRAN